MGRGKEWTKEESLVVHLAESWVAMSEGDGANKVIGMTNQSVKQFWHGVMEIFVTKAPQPTPPGVYGIESGLRLVKVIVGQERLYPGM
jgi:hypothetical protein